jgi:hypothetical protein
MMRFRYRNEIRTANQKARSPYSLLPSAAESGRTCARICESCLHVDRLFLADRVGADRWMHDDQGNPYARGSHVSRFTAEGSLSSRMATKCECRRCCAFVHSTNSTRQTSSGLTIGILSSSQRSAIRLTNASANRSQRELRACFFRTIPLPLAEERQREGESEK